MTVLFSIFSIAVFGQTQSRNVLSFFVEGEGQVAQHRQYIDSNLSYMFSRMGYMNHHGIGPYLSFISTLQLFQYETGFIIRRGKKIGWELTAGIKVAVPPKGNSSFGITNSLKIVTRPYFDRSSWKVELFGYVDYLSKYGYWYRAYGLVSPLRWLSVGLHSQTGMVDLGIRGQINLPLFKFWVAYDKKRTIIALNVRGKWQQPKKMGNRL